MSEPVLIPQTLSIKWLREKYLEKAITPDQVINEIINRALEDKQMNIWITPPDLAFIHPYLEHLSTLDIEQSPLWGIPFAIKDNIDLAGVPTTAACPDYAYTPKEHATVVRRLIDSGAVPVGKTNLDQFATGLVGTRSPYGETHNALKDELISGGSSAGSSVAVARGQAAFALGTDTAGSGRVPAALNGLFGFKPSLGAWSTKGVVPACASLDCVTVFTNLLDDVYSVDKVVRALDKKNSWSKSMPSPLPALPQKIYLPKTDLVFYGPYGTQYKRVWLDTIKKICKSGIPVEMIENNLFSEAGRLLYEGPFVSERWADLGDFVTSHPGALYPVTEKILRSGEKHTASELFSSVHQLAHFKSKARDLLKDAVLIMPTAGGTWTREQVRNDPIRTNSMMGGFTNHCNLLDLCAISVPSMEAAEKVPFGITLFSLSEHEDFILGLAEKFLNPSKKINNVDEETENVSNDDIFVAVCGLHMKGFPLEKQMHDHRARFIREAKTASKYQLFKLNTVPQKPGLVKKAMDGTSIKVEIWAFPAETFGSFVASVQSPLSIGKIELRDGGVVSGFICEPYATKETEDISHYGGWRNFQEGKQTFSH